MTEPITACNVGFWVDNSSGVLKNVSGQTSQVAIKIDHNTGEAWTFGNQTPYRKGCGYDVSIDFTILYTTAADEGCDIMRDWVMTNDVRSVEIYVPKKDVGEDKYSGEFIIEGTEINLEAGKGDPVTITGSLKVSGSFAHTNVAT